MTETEEQPKKKFKYGTAFGDRMMSYPKGKGNKYEIPALTKEKIEEINERRRRILSGNTVYSNPE